NHRVRQGARLDQEEPVIYPGGPFFGEIAVREQGRGQSVEDRQFRDLVRIVERHATRHSRSLVVADYSELFKTEVSHDFDLVLSHGAFGEIGMIRSVRGLAAAALIDFSAARKRRPG